MGKSGLKPHADILRLLANKGYSTKFKQRVLQEAPNATISKLCECIYNTLKGVVPLSKCQKRKLAPSKHVLRKLVQPGLSVQQRRRTLVRQTGKGLPILPLISMIAPLLLKGI